MATPFGADGEIDAAALRTSVGRAIEAGVNGLAPCGSTGEFTAVIPTEGVSGVRGGRGEIGGVRGVLATDTERRTAEVFAGTTLQ